MLSGRNAEQSTLDVKLPHQISTKTEHTNYLLTFSATAFICVYFKMTMFVLLLIIVSNSTLPRTDAYCTVKKHYAAILIPLPSGQPLRPSLKKTESGQATGSMSESFSGVGDGGFLTRDRRSKLGRQTSLSQSIRG